MMVHLSASYPDGSVGWVVTYVAMSEPPDEFLHGMYAVTYIQDVVELITQMYHDLIGPAYGLDDFTYTFWVFSSPEEMFYACGEHLMATDGMVANYRRPGGRG
jgi:hypothetical protein